MSSSNTCNFGHIFDVYDHDENGAPNGDIRSKIKSGKIRDLHQLESEIGTDEMAAIMGDHYKSLKVSANSQGTPYTVAWACADDFDENLNYTVEKSTEDIFVSPQSNLHDEFINRKQQAEQRLNQTLGNLSERRQQKHLLEHDIRKLRSRVEAMNSGDETQIKSDFVELVDGAGGGAQQGSDEAPLKTLRDQNLYPSIVADFYEMESLKDLQTADERDDDKDGKLSNLPRNEKAILKKKYVMYEKWKDLYGSEIQRKLEELKGQLKNVERSIQEVEDWLEPYVRDVAMINQTSQEKLENDTTFHVALKGSATMRRDLEFICYRPLHNSGTDLVYTDDEEKITHYRIVVIKVVHVSIASGEQPNSPNGPSAAKMFYYPAIVCEHVFERFFQQKIDKQKNRFQDMMKDYTGELEPENGRKMKEARQDQNMSVRELRESVKEQIGEEPPLELSATIRRVEDGVEKPQNIEEKYGEETFDAIIDILDVSLGAHEHGEEMLSPSMAKIRKLTGQVDEYVIPSEATPLEDLQHEMKFKYYYDFKLGLGLHTMK